MNLLINESPLQVLPSLAMQVGLNAAILLQQLHFRSLISPNVRDGHKWVYSRAVVKKHSLVGRRGFVPSRLQRLEVRRLTGCELRSRCRRTRRT